MGDELDMAARLVAARAEAVRRARQVVGRDLDPAELGCVIEEADAAVGEEAFREGGRAWADWNAAMLDLDDEEGGGS